MFLEFRLNMERKSKIHSPQRTRRKGTKGTKEEFENLKMRKFENAKLEENLKM
jgi:hypothetical protein